MKKLEITCAHHWREWIIYYDEKQPDNRGMARTCARCPAIQRNQDPEPRIVIAHLEQPEAPNEAV